ncbi:MAG: PAS domain S-box protein [Thermodesulfobacteriota bacterium]
MPGHELIWLGPDPAGPLATLRQAFGPQAVRSLAEPQAVLELLAAQPGRFGVLAVAAGAAPQPADWLTEVKRLCPDLEVVLLGRVGGWSGLPRRLWPLCLPADVSPQDLVAGVAKLRELAELRRDQAKQGQALAGRLAVARRNVEAALGLLYRTMGVGIVTVRRDGFVAFYDSEVRRLTGSAPAELSRVGDWLKNLAADPAQAAEVLAALDQAWSGGGRRELSLTLAHPDGAGRTLSLSLMLLVGDQGDPRQLVLVFSDPSDRAAALEYERLLAAPTLAAYVYYPERGFARLTPAALELINQAFDLALTPAQVLGRRPEELPLPPEAARRWQELLGLAVAGQAAGSPPPLGLPGQRILRHAALAPVEREVEGPGVVALLGRRPELAEAAAAMPGGLAGLALASLPTPLILLEAVRGEGREVEDFIVAGVNPAAWRLLGRLDFFRPQMRLAELLPDPAAQGRLFAEALRLTEEGGQARLEMGLRPQGARSGSRLISLWLGKVGDGVAVLMEDVGLQREQEQRQKLYRHVFGHMQEAIIVTDLAGLIIDWNPASERMFGYAKDQVLGQDTRLLVPPSRSRELGQYGARVLKEGNVWKGEYEFVRQDGSRGIASTVLAVLKDDEGRAYGTVGLSRDVTAERRLQENLSLQSRELQEKNIALNTLLRHAEEERLRACQQVAADLAQRITQRLQQILDHVETPDMVRDLAGLLLSDLGRRPEGALDPTDPTLALSEKELEVARLIRAGKSSEQIALLLGKSLDTIRLQRISIRKKLGLTRRDRNLANYLNKLDVI